MKHNVEFAFKKSESAMTNLCVLKDNLMSGSKSSVNLKGNAMYHKNQTYYEL